MKLLIYIGVPFLLAVVLYLMSYKKVIDANPPVREEDEFDKNSYS